MYTKYGLALATIIVGISMFCGGGDALKKEESLPALVAFVNFVLACILIAVPISYIRWNNAINRDR